MRKRNDYFVAFFDSKNRKLIIKIHLAIYLDSKKKDQTKAKMFVFLFKSCYIYIYLSNEETKTNDTTYDFFFEIREGEIKTNRIG